LTRRVKTDHAKALNRGIFSVLVDFRTGFFGFFRKTEVGIDSEAFSGFFGFSRFGRKLAALCRVYFRCVAFKKLCIVLRRRAKSGLLCTALTCALPVGRVFVY